jgi:hypothetical protein
MKTRRPIIPTERRRSLTTLTAFSIDQSLWRRMIIAAEVILKANVRTDWEEIQRTSGCLVSEPRFETGTRWIRRRICGRSTVAPRTFICVFFFSSVSVDALCQEGYEKVYRTDGFVVGTPVYLFDIYEFIFSLKHKHKHNLLRITGFLDFVHHPVF